MDKLKFVYENDTLTIKVIGDIDHHSAQGVRSIADGVIFEKRPRLVILDLSAVEFMDSSGLGLILGRYNASEEIGAEFKIYKPARNVQRVLELAGIERIIKIEGGK